jgi:signal transduction histidine kinase
MKAEIALRIDGERRGLIRQLAQRGQGIMSVVREKLFPGPRRALRIAAIYLLLSAIWIYVSNYLLFEDSSVTGIQVVGEIEAFSDATVAFATAILLYYLVRYSIARLERSERDLRDQTERLQALSRKLVQVQEVERRGIAQELHDEIGQTLTGLKLSLEMADRLSSGPARDSLSGALSLVNELMSRVRNLSLNLRPVALDDLGLLPALQWYFERYTKQTGVQIDFRHQGLEGRRFAGGLENAAYRIIQEALTNAARHARAKSTEIRAWADDASLSLHVEDHGDGFDAGAVLGHPNSSGLTGMQERAFLLGGRLTIDTQPTRGTRVMAVLPLSAVGTRAD